MTKRPLKSEQIRLIQTAVRAAGLRTPHADGRYRLLLAQYTRPDGRPCQSCKELNNWQVDDLLAICEGLGWRHPDKPDDYYRRRNQTAITWATPAQIAAIRHLAGDLGWTADNLNGMIARMTGGRCDRLATLTRRDGYVLIEALKAILSRQDGTAYRTLDDAADAYTDQQN